MRDAPRCLFSICRKLLSASQPGNWRHRPVPTPRLKKRGKLANSIFFLPQVYPWQRVSEIIEFANRGKLDGKLAKSFWQSPVIWPKGSWKQTIASGYAGEQAPGIGTSCSSQTR